MKAGARATATREQAASLCPAGEDCRYRDELARLGDEVERLRREVRTDALTGLFNYRHFAELLDQEVERSNRSGLSLALIMVDLDHFKHVNDRWGHEVGNQALRLVADILRGGVRRIDAVCRYGGEEMVLLLPGTVLGRAVKVAERIRKCIEDAVLEVDGGRLELTASFGVGVYPAKGVQGASGLVEATDTLLYRAKQEWRNRVCHMELVPALPESQVTLDEKRALTER